MSEKNFIFDDGSWIRFVFVDGSLSFVIQAKNLGKENKITSTTVELSSENTSELLAWIGEKLVGGEDV